MKRPRIHREGRNPIIGLVLLLFIVNVIVYMSVSSHWALGVSLTITSILLVFVTYFFRNPVRVLEIDDPNFVIAPADGRVVVIEPTEENYRIIAADTENTEWSREPFPMNDEAVIRVVKETEETGKTYKQMMQK